MAAAFSRIQLAAALIEYDNDDSDPTKPRKSAQESVIFAHLRRNNPTHRSAARRSTDYLGVAIPGETGSMMGGESIVDDSRRSRGSFDALRNPFGRDSTYEGILGEDEEENEMEVDLSSWGLDALLPQDKEDKDARKKAKSEVLPNPHAAIPSERPSGARSEMGRQGVHAGRTMSMGNFDSFGEGGAFLDARPTMGSRRHSIGTALDFPQAKRPVEQRTHRGRTASSHALIENIPPTPPLHSIPFPTSESVRSVSPLPTEGTPMMRPSSLVSENVLNRAHGRTYSTASLGSQMLSNEEQDEELPNPFAVRPPSPDRASRFDPKARARTASQASFGALTPGLNGDDTNPFALRPPSPSRSSRFDPKAIRARTVSNGSLGTQMLLDNDRYDARSSSPDASPRPRRYSRLELMRPKVLIMPSPLQSAARPSQPSMPPRSLDGFEMHTDGPPLPPGARAARRAASSTMSMIDTSTSPGLVASNSFTPNPRASLTLSQLTFRNTLAVDGQRDPSYADIESHLRRATHDGQQIEPEPEPEPEPNPTTPMPPPAIVLDPADRSRRPAGKLYGKSLIDALESRKAEMKGKQRTFRGDERPSMMARTPMQRSSTLIDPESLKQRPQSQHMDSYHSQPNLSRRNSKTLVNLEDGIPGVRASQHLGAMDSASPGNKKSVFGVDTLWERELAKLREMEQQERHEAEDAARRQTAEDAKHGKKGKKGKKSKKGKHTGEEPESSEVLAESATNLTLSSAPEEAAPGAASPSYVLPNIPRASARRRPPPPTAGDDQSDGESDSDTPGVNNRKTLAKEVEADQWVAGSSDEEDRVQRLRVPGTGPRFVKNSGSNRVSTAPNFRKVDDESSEEDLPLVATIDRAARRMTRANLQDDDSDEEKPLSVILDKTLDKTKLKLSSVGSFGDSLFPDSAKGDQDEEDDKPLGLRVSRVINSSQALSSASQEADDDKPLAFHPEQMRRTQYMMAQQQQQQQQLMMQAQFTQSMIFGTPSMMASGFFGPPMPPPMMMPPQLPATPPPMHETGKFGRVDKWRHDVAVEGPE